MQLIVAALIFGAACAADGCLVGAALAAVLLNRSPIQWSIFIGLGHTVLMGLGILLAGAIATVSEAAAAALTLLGTSFLLYHLLKIHDTTAPSTPCCTCSARHEPGDRGSTGLRCDFLSAFAMSGDALVGGIAFRGLFPSSSALSLSLACGLSGLVTGVLVYFTIRGVRWSLVSDFGQRLRLLCPVFACGVLGVVWAVSLAELVGDLTSLRLPAAPWPGVVGGTAAAGYCVLSLRRASAVTGPLLDTTHREINEVRA